MRREIKLKDLKALYAPWLALQDGPVRGFLIYLWPDRDFLSWRDGI